MNKLGLGLAALGLIATGAGVAATHTERSGPGPAGSAADAPQVDPSGARTRLGDLAPAPHDPVPDGLTTVDPAPGSVVRLVGPFDDRFEWRRVRLSDAAVSGEVRVTSDVSDLLELQVVSGFYDARGRYLGRSRSTHHLDGAAHAHSGPPSETEVFTVRAPAQVRDRTASASVAVTVLVNE